MHFSFFIAFKKCQVCPDLSRTETTNESPWDVSHVGSLPHKRTRVYTQLTLQTSGCVLASDSDRSVLSSGLSSQSRPLERKPQGLRARTRHYAEIAVWHPDTWCLGEEGGRKWVTRAPLVDSSLAVSPLIVWNQPTWQERADTPIWISFFFLRE